MDSDPDLEIIEKDSGMSSLGGSKDETPERRAVIEDVDDELDVKDVKDEKDDKDDKDEIIEEIIEEIITPSQSLVHHHHDDTENYDDEPDETLTERLWGLTEMLPECVRNACESTTDITINSTKTMYKFSCNASWIFFTSSMILFAPVLFETERAQMVELERSQKQQVLLGPGAAMPGGVNPNLPALPPMAR